MNFKEWEILLIKNSFVANTIKSINYYPVFPLENQICKGSGKNFWCTDYRDLEILKCWYIGFDAYRNNPIPRRLIGNVNFSIDKIIEESKKRIERMQEIEAKSELYDSIYISNVGRGTDVVLALLVKDWDHIAAVDSFDYQEKLKLAFGEKIVFYRNLNLNLKDCFKIENGKEI